MHILVAEQEAKLNIPQALLPENQQTRTPGSRREYHLMAHEFNSTFEVSRGQLAMTVRLEIPGLERGSEASTIQDGEEAHGQKEANTAPGSTLHVELVGGSDITVMQDYRPVAGSPVCVLRVRTPGEKMTPEKMASTALDRDNSKTQNPRFGFVCGFFAAVPKITILEITIWNAEELGGVTEGFENLPEILHYGRGTFHRAFIGTVLLDLQQLIPHSNKTAALYFKILRPTKYSAEISSTRILQAWIRRKRQRDKHYRDLLGRLKAGGSIFIAVKAASPSCALETGSGRFL